MIRLHAELYFWYISITLYLPYTYPITIRLPGHTILIRIVNVDVHKDLVTPKFNIHALRQDRQVVEFLYPPSSIFFQSLSSSHPSHHLTISSFASAIRIKMDNSRNPWTGTPLIESSTLSKAAGWYEQPIDTDQNSKRPES